MYYMSLWDIREIEKSITYEMIAEGWEYLLHRVMRGFSHLNSCIILPIRTHIITQHDYG